MLTSLISVVDNDASVRKTTTLLVESRGFHAPGFESSDLFPKPGQLHETSCLIVDLRMPGMNGVQLQNHFAALGCEIRIIFFTAYQDKASRRRALQAGAVTFLGKRFSDGLLLQAIRAGRRHRDEQETKESYGCTDHMICFALIRGLGEVRVGG
jgi:FixJ family two-component response regulator